MQGKKRKFESEEKVLYGMVEWVINRPYIPGELGYNYEEYRYKIYRCYYDSELKMDMKSHMSLLESELRKL